MGREKRYPAKDSPGWVEALNPNYVCSNINDAMTTRQKLSISKVIKLIQNEQPIINVKVSEPLSLNHLVANERLHLNIEFRDCYLHSLALINIHCYHPVVLKNTVISPHNVSLTDWIFQPELKLKTWSSGFFLGTYFHAGLLIENCSFKREVDFQSGGHNCIDKPIIIRNSKFHKFVNFLDCWFSGPIEVQNCCFKQGTNLLGNQGQPYQVQFDLTPVIKGNYGVLDLNGG